MRLRAGVVLLNRADVAASRNRGGWATIGVCAGVNVVCTLPLFLSAALVVQIREDVPLGVAALGLATAAFRASGAASALRLGRLTDRRGWHWALRLSTLTTAVVCGSIALLADGLAMLLVLLVVAGAAQALGQAGSNLCLATEIDQRRQGIAFGVKQAALPASTLLAGLAVPWIGLSLGWRWAFAAAAVFAGAVATRVPRSSHSDSEVERPVLDSPADVAIGLPSRSSLLVLSAGLFCSLAAAASLGIFTVDAAIGSGLGVSSAGLVLTAGSCAAIVTRVGATAWMDRHASAPLQNAAWMMLLGAGGFLLMARATAGLFVLGVIISFGFGWGFSGLFWYAVVRLRPHSSGRVTGIVMPGGLIGGTVGPLVFGRVVEAHGFDYAWSFAALAAVLGAVLVLVGERNLA